MSNTSNRFDHINQRIVQAFKANGRSLHNPVTLLAASKRQSLDNIEALYQLGQRDFGESYLQEALSKISKSPHADIIWHFIGPIQSNKTRQIAQHFHWVHSVDRVKIARRLNSQRLTDALPLNICLQVNISQETQKSGFSSTEIRAAIREITRLPNLILRGLMAIPKPVQHFEQQRLAFRKLRDLLQQMNQDLGLNMDTLSMGMSNDLEAAIAEGATIIRIGTALFGHREK